MAFLHLNHSMWAWAIPYYRPQTRKWSFTRPVNLCRMCILENGILTSAVMTKNLNLELCCTCPTKLPNPHCIRQRGRVDYLQGPFKNPSTILEVKKQDVKSCDYVVS